MLYQRGFTFLLFLFLFLYTTSSFSQDFDCQYLTIQGNSSPALGDFNGDGQTDMAGYTGSISLWHVCFSLAQQPLPGELAEIAVVPTSSCNLLSWITLSESNNQGFEILRSTDGKHWLVIGFMEGLNGVNNDYQFCDESFVPGLTNYYKLKQFDVNGDYSFSPIVSASHEMTTDVFSFPNPSSGKLFLAGDLSLVRAIRILDSTGRLIMAENFNGSTDLPNFDITEMQQGTYIILCLGQQGNVLHQEFVVKQ